MKKILIISVLILGISYAKAQENSSSLSLNLGSGFHNLKYSLANGEQKNSAGLSFNLGYNYFYAPNWGVTFGLGFETFQTSATLNYQTSNSSIDTDGESFEFRTQYSDWQEKQKVKMMDIPVGFIYQKKLQEKWKIQISAGPKVSFAIRAKYETTGGTIETTGFYPQYNAVLFGMPQHNFQTISDFPKDKINLNPVVSAFVNPGGLYRLNENTELYFGAYFEIGLNNAVKPESRFLYQENGLYNGVLNSDQTEKVIPLTFGIKLGINWQLGKKAGSEI